MIEDNRLDESTIHNVGAGDNGLRTQVGYWACR